MVKAATKAQHGPHGGLTWIVSGLGLLVVLAALTIVGRDAFGPSEPARLEAAETGRSARGGMTLVEIEVRNLGDQAVAAVEVEGSPHTGAPGHVSLDYVAGQSGRKATLAFAGEPGPVTVTVRGWTEP